jgi:subtilisin-like proprotein convertase family protein
MKQTHHLSRLLLIGSIGLAALVACQAPDSTPDAFSFEAKTGLSITESGNIESDAATISGMSAPASISVTGGKYGIDGSSCQTGPGTISVGQKLRLCASNPSKFGQESTVTVNVGGVAGSFKASAENLEAITFAAASFDPTGAVESSAITPAWTSNLAELDVNASVTGVTGATGGFKISTGTCQTKGKATDSIKACANVPNTTANGSKVTVTLEFGSSITGKVSKSFVGTVGPLTVESLVLTPGNFSAVQDAAKNTSLISNELTVTGIAANTTALLSVTPATATIYIDGIAKPGTTGIPVSNNQKIKLALTSSASDDTLSTATLTVTAAGKQANATYSVRTAGVLGPFDFKPDQPLIDFRALVPWAKTDPAPPQSFTIADTSPTCVYGSGGPWRRAQAGDTVEFRYNKPGYEFVKSGLPKDQWNSCPANWNETEIINGTAVGRQFGKTSLSFNITSSGNISKVELKLKVPHQSRADLFMTLISPDGTRVVIFDLEKDSLGKGLRGTQFSNPNVYDASGYPLPESAGLSLIFDDAAVPPMNDTDTAQLPAEAATIPYRCGPNNRTPTGGTQQKGNSLGACWDNSNSDARSNYPHGGTGFGSFGRVKPSNPLSAFNGLPMTGIWKLEIEDRTPGNQESNDDTFPPFRPLDLPGQSPKNDYSSPAMSVTAVPGDDKQLVRQPANGTLTPKVRVAILTVQ